MGAEGWTHSEGRLSSSPPEGSRQSSKLSGDFREDASEGHAYAGYPPDVDPVQRTPPSSTGPSPCTLYPQRVSLALLSPADAGLQPLAPLLHHMVVLSGAQHL